MTPLEGAVVLGVLWALWGELWPCGRSCGTCGGVLWALREAVAPMGEDCGPVGQGAVGEQKG